MPIQIKDPSVVAQKWAKRAGVDGEAIALLRAPHGDRAALRI